MILNNKITITALLLCALVMNANARTNGAFSLPNLINKAIAYHPSIKSSVFLENSAKDEITGAKWRYFPTPSFSVKQVKASSTDINYGGDERIALLSFSQPLWAGGAIDARLENSREKFSVAHESTRIAERDLALKVIKAYSRWYDSFLKKEAYGKSKKEHDMLNVRLKRRIEQGLSSISDLKLATSRTTQSGTNLNSAIIQHENALRNLEELLGLKLDPEALIRDFYIIEFGNNLEKLKSRALLLSPQIKKNQAESRALKSELKQAKASLYPGINLRVERQWGDFTRAESSPQDRIFLELSSSFGAGLSSLSQVKQIKHRYKSAQSKIQDAKNKIAQQIELDWASSKSYKQQQELLLISLENIKEVQKSWYRQFLAGRKQWNDVMTSIREVSQLEAQLANVYAETATVNWRIFIYVKRMNNILKPFSNTKPKRTLNSSKTLWRPGVENVPQAGISDKVLDLIFTKDEDEVDKIVWSADVETHQNIIKTVKDNGFSNFIKKMDNWSPSKKTSDKSIQFSPKGEK
ncbi:hypothetical protein THERMOT_1224 [Bathymodiolus thermophilus thioautotrophic gill symbiont]|nr:hypothetical protein THERMOT_1224 [Bathymodiolus thermophilus thioautotrophic gill symbiont]